MIILFAVSIFMLSFAAMAVSSLILSESLEKFSTRFGLSGGLLGMFVALGADAPEISSAITALFVKQRDIGVGIIVGSNIFNLAALLGLSMLVVRKLYVRRRSILFNGVVSLAVIFVLILFIFRFIAPWVSVILVMIIFIPYVIILGLKPNQTNQRILPEKLRNFFIATDASTPYALRQYKPAIWKLSPRPWLAWPAIVAIILTSIGTVRSAVFLSNTWGVSKVVVGVLIIPILTSIPNVLTAVKLALDNKGVAVVSESLNSNTINIIFGISIPATILSLGLLTKQTIFSVWWLLGMTVIALLLLYFERGFNRTKGAVLAIIYLVFVAAIVIWK